MARVTHAVESLVLITPQRSKPSLSLSGDAVFGKTASHPRPVWPSRRGVGLWEGLSELGLLQAHFPR